MNIHYPVLLEEALTELQIIPEGIYIDGTFGQGGHSRGILEKLGSKGLLFAIDKDPNASTYITEQNKQDIRFQFSHASFDDLDKRVMQWGIMGKVNGLLLDLGLSSTQLDNPKRGFSFLKEGVLDMRMDPARGPSAFKWLAQASIEEMTDIFKKYGEERWSKRIAQAIYAAKKIQPIRMTTQLAEIVKKAHPRWPRRVHPATRIFQAIRIHINCELTTLQHFLEKSLDILAPQGRMAIITFHSLEAKVVKNFAHQMAKKQPGRLQWAKKSIKPSSQEISDNPRSRSAILRILEKKS